MLALQHFADIAVAAHQRELADERQVVGVRNAPPILGR
jgi:hypothetical protein